MIAVVVYGHNTEYCKNRLVHIYANNTDICEPLCIIVS